MRVLLLTLAAFLAARPALAQESAGQAVVPSTASISASTASLYGTPIEADKGPWVIGGVHFEGQKAVSVYALRNRVRARRGLLYTPADLASDLGGLLSMPNLLSARARLYAMPKEPVPESYAAISVSTSMVNVVFTVEEKELYLPGLPAAEARAPEGALPDVSLSGIVLTPTAYRGTGRNNKPGLSLDYNTVYYIGRLYGKNSYSYTKEKTNYIDRIGVWLFSVDGKMQLQSEGAWRPAMAVGGQGVYSFRDAQPSLQTFTVTIKPSEKSKQVYAGSYVVLSKNIKGLRSSLGYMRGNAGNQVAPLSEFLSAQALLFNGHANQTASSKDVLFGSLLLLPKPQYPLAVEFFKPNGMALSPILLNFKLGYFLKLNFDVAYLKYRGAWDLLGMFQFRYTQFPKK